MIYTSIQDTNLIDVIKHGAVGVLPTDTIYGIVCAASNREAATRLYTAKHREHKPGTVIAASVEQLVTLGISEAYLEKVAPYWPNPLSIIIPMDDPLAYLHMGLGDGAFRVVDNQAVRTLLEQTGPLLTSSANQPGEPPARSIQEAQAYFGNTIDYYVDGGVLPECVPSTIVRFRSSGELEVLRQGAITID